MKRLAVIFVAACGASSASQPAHVSIAAPTPATPIATTPAAPTTTPDAMTTDGCIVIHEADLGGEATTLEGSVMCGQGEHPNGSTFDFCLVVLDPMRCVKGSSHVTEVGSVQLMSIDFTKMNGKRVRVHGAPFPQHTAWHVQPVLMTVDRFEPL